MATRNREFWKEIGDDCGGHDEKHQTFTPEHEPGEFPAPVPGVVAIARAAGSEVIAAFAR